MTKRLQSVRFLTLVDERLALGLKAVSRSDDYTDAFYMSSRVKINIIFGVVITALIALSQLSYENMTALGTRGRNRQTLLSINAVLAAVKDAETGQRGYLLTGMESYLEPYISGRKLIKDRLLEVRTALQDNPNQLKRLSELEPLIEEKMLELDHTVELRKSRGLKAALPIVLSNKGHTLMVGIRTIIGDMQKEQDVLLQARLDSRERELHQGVMSILVGSMSTLLLAIFAVGFMNRDITLRQRIEEERQKLKEELDRFFSVSLDMLCIAGMDGYFKRMNPAWKDALGFTPEELCTRPIMEFVHPEDRESTIKEIEKQSKGQRVLSFENRYLCKDGSYRWLSWKSVPIGGLMYAAARDITQEKEIGDALVSARIAAEEAAKAKSDFLASMSHEIRTPMNGVIGMTGLLLDTEMTSQQKEFAETIRSSADGLLVIINDILDFSKIEAGKLTFEKMNFDLRQSVENSLELLAHSAHLKKIELAALIEPEVPVFLLGDSGRIKQVLTNLIGNAIKFTPAQGEVAVRVSKVNDNENEVTIRFEVKDTGIGISEDVQKKLFQAFSQADSSTVRKYGGTGLGLAISKQLVTLMRGQIGVISQLNEGSTFWFTLVLEKQAVAQRFVSQRAELLSGLRILVVDDNETNQKIIHQQILSWGMRNGSPRTGAAALDILRAEAAKGDPYDIAVLDMYMPEMDGLTLARAIKADQNIAQTRLILLTSVGGMSEREIRDAGISAWVSKPVKQSILYDCLVTVMEDQTRQNKLNVVPISAPPVLQSIDGRNIRILVAEDNTVNQKIALMQLKKLGFQADAVANGKEALAALASVPYDLLLLDCLMPEMDGYQTTREIRSRSDLKDTVIIAMTANALQGDKEKCLAAGMNDYVSKPIKVTELEVILNRWLKGVVKNKAA